MDIKQLYMVFTQKVSATAGEKNGADFIILLVVDININWLCIIN